MPMELKLQPLIWSLEASPHHLVVVSDKHSRIKEHYMYYFAVGEVVKFSERQRRLKIIFYQLWKIGPLLEMLIFRMEGFYYFLRILIQFS